MTYVLPSPSVKQNFIGTAPSLNSAVMLPCLIGSLKQSVVKNSIKSLFTTLPVTSQAITFANLGLKSQAVFDNSSVAIFATNAFTSVVSGTASGVAGDSFITATAAPTGALKDDTLVITVSASPLVTKSYKIASINSDIINFANGATLDYDLTAITFKVVRSVGNVECNFTATFSSTAMTLTALTYASAGIAAADDILISYTATRHDLNNTFYKVTDLSLLALDMDINPGNPLGFYLGNIMASASGGSTALAYITPDNGTTSFNTALEALSTRQDPYLITFIGSDNQTQESAKARALATYVQQESKNFSDTPPGPSYYRSAIVPAMTIDAVTYTTRLTTTYSVA